MAPFYVTNLSLAFIPRCFGPACIRYDFMIRTLRQLPLIVVLSAGAAMAQPPENVPAQEKAASSLPVQELTGKILYQFLLAEIAAQRGQFAFAAGAYLDLAKQTKDPRIARRSAEIALHARQYDTALEAVHVWELAEPDSIQAQQMESTLLLASGRLEELGQRIAVDLKGAGPRTGEILMRLIRSLARHPDKAAIQGLLTRITQPYLALPEAHLARAQGAAGVADAPLASSEIDEALRLRPNWELAALFKSDMLSRSKIDNAQVAFLQGFLAANPDARDVRLAYARVLVAEKRYDVARVEFRRLLELSPDNPDVLYAIGILSLQLEDSKEAEQQLKRFVTLGKGELDSARFYLGQIADQAGRSDDALRWYGEVAAGEHLASSRVRAAQVLLRLNRFDEAREHLAAARAGGVGDVRLLVAEAQLLRDSKRHVEAFDLLSKALMGKPDDPDLLYETALAAEKLEKYALMEQHLRHLIKLKPESAQGYNALGYSLADRNLRLDEAAILIDKALVLSPGDAYILDSKGWLLFRQGDAQTALETLQVAYAKKPDPEVAAHVGEVLWSLGRRDEATEVWSDATKLSPGNEVLAATIKRFVP